MEKDRIYLLRFPIPNYTNKKCFYIISNSKFIITKGQKNVDIMFNKCVLVLKKNLVDIINILSRPNCKNLK